MGDVAFVMIVFSNIFGVWGIGRKPKSTGTALKNIKFFARHKKIGTFQKMPNIRTSADEAAII
jgi:hypothetical protein